MFTLVITIMAAYGSITIEQNSISGFTTMESCESAAIRIQEHLYTDNLKPYLYDKIGITTICVKTN